MIHKKNVFLDSNTEIAVIMICFPNAKINLGLYITERRPDGYHNLETIFLPIPLTDVLETRPLDFYDKEYEFIPAGIPIPGMPEDNLVVRVFLDLKREFHLPPQTIHLYKRIPTGAGLGGGSSDAAFMMRMLSEQFHLSLTPSDMERRLSQYGADCPFFVRNRPSLGKGIGDVLSPVDIDLSHLTLLLIKPNIAVSTRDAYAGVHPQAPVNTLTEAIKQPITLWKELISNDFENTVFLKHPPIAAIKQTLYDMGALYVSMSGSGSAVCALMKHEVEEAKDVFPNCFVFQQRFKLHQETFS